MVDAGEHAFERVLIAFFIADKFDVQVFRDLLELGADADEVARYLLSEIEDVARLLQCLIGIRRVSTARNSPAPSALALSREPARVALRDPHRQG